MVAGPLGCFLVWRRMSYFGATLSHTALLGVALGILFGFNPLVGVVVACMVVAVAVFSMERDTRFASDTILGILAHGMLAIGLVLIAFIESFRIDIMSYLFGDILAVSEGDLISIYGGGVVCLME